MSSWMFRGKATWTEILYFGLRGSGFSMPVCKAVNSPLLRLETQGPCLTDEQDTRPQLDTSNVLHKFF